MLRCVFKKFTHSLTQNLSLPSHAGATHSELRELCTALGLDYITCVDKVTLETDHRPRDVTIPSKHTKLLRQGRGGEHWR